MDMQERDLSAEARERHQPLRDAAESLGRAAAGTRSDRFDRIATELANVSTALADHVKLTEGPDGIHNELVTIAPRLSSDIRLLTKDHDFMEFMIEAAEAELRTEEPNPSVVDDHVNRLLDRIARHRLRDAEMVYEAYDVDIGGQA
jgi:hypothetical protein